MIPSILKKGARRPIARMGTAMIVARPDLHEAIRRRVIHGGLVPNVGTDNTVVVEVTSAGPGREVNGKFVKSELKQGDIAFMPGFFAGRCHTLHGVQHWAVDADRLFAVMENLNDPMPRLLSRQVATAKNYDWAEYEFRGPGSALAVPFDDDGTFVAGNGRDPQRLSYQEVIAVGPGVEGVEVGDLVPVPKDRGSYEVTVHGHTFTVCRDNMMGCVVAKAKDRPAHIKPAYNPERER